MKHIKSLFLISLIYSIPSFAQDKLESSSQRAESIEQIGIYKSIPFNQEEALAALIIQNEMDESARQSIIEILENYYEQLPCSTNINGKELNRTITMKPAFEGQTKDWVSVYMEIVDSYTIYVKGLSNDLLYIAWQESGKWMKTGHKSVYRYENIGQSISQERKIVYHEEVEKTNQSASQLVLSKKDEIISTETSRSTGKTIINDELTHYQRKLVIIIANFESCPPFSSPEIICGNVISGWGGEPSSGE